MRLGRFVFIACCGIDALVAQRLGDPTDDLTKVGIDELFRLEVTSVDRKAQKLSKAPAAVYVLTAEDIRRSGASSIPEALEWVPGLTVSRLDGRSWMISARGSTRLYADKILVMIDGRSLYTPLFSGVVWDAIDVPLENIERIEVVLGPGAVMWGPNAVNGVINIITRSARQTRGAEVSAATGNELHGSVMARWGAAVRDRVAWRIWGKLDQENPAFGSPAYYQFNAQYPFLDARPVQDLNAESARMGFRVDADVTRRDALTVQGDIYASARQDPFAYPVLMPNLFDRVQRRSSYSGGYLQGTWTRVKDEGNDSTLQFAFDRNDIGFAFVGAEMNNLTVDYHNRRQTSERNEVHWGVGFQEYWDDSDSRAFARFVPERSRYVSGDVVIRDEFQIVPDRLLVSAGIRIDYTSWTHFELQPSVRLLYTPSSRESLWAAISRAVRTPSRYDRDLSGDGGLEEHFGIPMQVELLGSQQMRSETELSYELGYRFQAGQRWSMDASAYYSDYDRLRGLTSPGPVFVSATAPPLLRWTFGNPGRGRSLGSEFSATWQVRNNWRLIPSWSWLSQEERLAPTVGQLVAFDARFADPRHQALLRSQHHLSRRLKADFMARARTRNSAYDVPGFLLFDARLSYQPTRKCELSISLHNLLDRQALESYSEPPFVAIPDRRTFVVRWRQSF
jgi:iron complex outermembrane receptor protein